MSLAFVIGGALGFVLGFLAHKYKWYDAVRPFILFLFRRTGGCSLAETVHPRTREIERLIQQFRSASKLVRTDGDFELWETPGRSYWIPAVSENLFHTLADQEIRKQLYRETQVRAGDVVLDCGANIGVFTAMALAAGAELVVAIEPVPKTLECLRRNFQSEIQAGRVVICPTGLWREEGFREMYLHKESTLDSFVIARVNYLDPPRRVSCPVTTLDNLVQQLSLSRVDFVKMDVEGAAREILLGARETLGKYHPRLAIATEELPDDYLVIPEIVREAWAGYRSVCGLCRLRSRFQIAPDMLYFY